MISENIFLSDLFKQKKQTLSFEIFPPKTNEGIQNLLDHLSRLKSYSPDFISVTYGAGGGNRDHSIKVLQEVHEKIQANTVAHFTCIGADIQSIDAFLIRVREMGIKNVLALRGDHPLNPPPGFDISKSVFKYASELVSYLKNKPCFSIGVAGHPEGHPEAMNLEEDWDHLKKKIDAGGEWIITQLFFDNAFYYRLREGMEKRNITVPLLPGILPVPSLERLEKTIHLSGSKITPSFQRIIDRYQNDPEGFRKASVSYVQEQISDLLANDVPGIHYCILNRSEMVIEVLTDL